ncbi:MAG: hypothetical protein LBP58_05320 [Azoarcus sp.]|jgi:hypothetical protein|nr:hypothetical protein [Azoarcus sp.]
MSGFGHYERTAAELENAIVTRGILLGLDWSDQVQICALASEALDCTPEKRLAMLRARDRRMRAKGELFAFSTLMLDIMRQGAQAGVRIPDMGVWQTFARALDDVSREAPKDRRAD